MNKYAGFMIAFTALWTLGCLPAAVQDSTGYQAPNFTVESLETPGEKVSLDDLKGKPILIDFWATWCGPCIAAMPEVQNIYEKYSSEGLVVLGISDEDRETVEAFHKRSPHSYPIYLDTSGEASRAYKVEAIPNFVVIGKNGKIIFQDSGFEKSAIERAVAIAVGG